MPESPSDFGTKFGVYMHVPATVRKQIIIKVVVVQAAPIQSLVWVGLLFHIGNAIAKAV